MQFAVEAWAPEYGPSVDDAVLTPSDEPVDVNVEVAAAAWAPRTAPPGVTPSATVLFVDGVQRMDARVWVTADDGTVSQGICASYAAGAVRCDGTARVVAVEVRRGLFCLAAGAGAIETRHGRYPPHATPGDGIESLAAAVHQQMGNLEVAVAEQAVAECSGEAGALIVVDGPLRQHHRLPGALGYIKSHRVAHGPAIVADTVARLDAGQRTPVFTLGERWQRYSWYLRLPGPRAHAWASIVRCEAPASLTADEVVALADRVGVTLPRFASAPHRDPRAPQNLYPIGGLERELRHRLGDAGLLFRALAVAASRFVHISTSRWIRAQTSRI